MRVGHHHKLTIVTGISENLLIAGHAGVEAKFAAGGTFFTDSDACSTVPSESVMSALSLLE
jgi:hypothetical protein